MRASPRRVWDSNPRWPQDHNGFRDRPVRPLRQLSSGRRYRSASTGREERCEQRGRRVGLDSGDDLELVRQPRVDAEVVERAERAGLRVRCPEHHPRRRAPPPRRRHTSGRAPGSPPAWRPVAARSPARPLHHAERAARRGRWGPGAAPARCGGGRRSGRSRPPRRRRRVHRRDPTPSGPPPGPPPSGPPTPSRRPPGHERAR